MTSVESLAHEAKLQLATDLLIRAAAQNQFGSHTVYTPVATTSDSLGEGSVHDGENGGKKRRGSKASDAVQSVIDNAKKLIHNVLGHEGGHKHEHGHGQQESEDLRHQVASLQKENKDIRVEMSELRKMVETLSVTIQNLQGAGVKVAAAAPTPGKPATAPAKEENDDDFDLFGSEDEDDEKKAEVEKRLKEYHEKKAKKPGPIAKSSVILDVKPWDDETNMKEMEDHVRSIQMDGLVWGGGKLIAIGYGISKLQIICVIEDDKVSVDDLIERITTDFESHVQSVDIAAFNKI